MEATDLAGHVFVGWALREANMRTVHVQLGEAPWINVLPDGRETVFRAPLQGGEYEPPRDLVGA